MDEPAPRAFFAFNLSQSPAMIKKALKHLIMEEGSQRIHDLDSAESYAAHREIFDRKPFLKEIYRSYFDDMLGGMGELSGKTIVELGAGAFNISDRVEGAIPTNSAANEFIKVAARAEELPFGDGTLDGIVMINTLHHVRRPKAFFEEASRTLKEGGMLAMIEPYFSLLGGLIYRRLHHEPVFETPANWEIPKSRGGAPCSSNQIMPYHIFTRDAELFKREFPELRLIRVAPHGFITHLLSGGITYKSVIPKRLEKSSMKLDKALSPLLGRFLAVFMTVVIVKEGERAC